jgi:hypothetical protein
LVAPSQPLERRFAVFSGTERIGHHRIRVASGADPSSFSLEANISLRMGAGAHAYRFEHESAETWAGGWLETVRGRTDDNGEEAFIEGRRTDQGIELETPNGPYIAGPHVLTSNSIWTERAMVETQIISVQFAAVVGIVTIPNGRTTVMRGDQRLLANRYEAVSPFTTATLWYDDAGHWVAAKVERRGEALDYRLEV